MKFILHVSFQTDQRCEPIYWNIVADIPPLDPREPIWPSITMVAFRTNILALIYLLFSTVWIITSLMLIGKYIFEHSQLLFTCDLNVRIGCLNSFFFTLCSQPRNC